MKIIDLPLSNAIRRLRLNSGSDSEVAEKLNLSRAHIGRILKGKINYFEDDTWKRIEPILSPYMTNEDSVYAPGGIVGTGNANLYNPAIIGKAKNVKHVLANGADVEAIKAQAVEEFRQQLKDMILDLDIDEISQVKVMKAIKGFQPKKAK